MYLIKAQQIWSYKKYNRLVNSQYQERGQYTTEGFLLTPLHAPTMTQTTANGLLLALPVIFP